MRATAAESAVAAVVVVADLLEVRTLPDSRGERPTLESLLKDTDPLMLAGVGGLLVHRLGEPGRAMLRELGLEAARTACEPMTSGELP